MLSGKQIAEARKRKGLTQEALAAELGVSRQTIAKWPFYCFINNNNRRSAWIKFMQCSYSFA